MLEHSHVSIFQVEYGLINVLKIQMLKFYCGFSEFFVFAVIEPNISTEWANMYIILKFKLSKI